METKGFSIGEVVKSGWRIMKDNIGFFIGLLLVSYIIIFLPMIIAGLLGEDALLLKIILYIIYIVLALLIGMGLIKISLQFCDNEKGRFGDLFSCFPLILKYLFAAILYILIFYAGLILLIFPGIIWGIKFSLFPYFIVDKNMGIIESLKASSRATKGAKWDILGFWFVAWVISLSGMLCLLIGLFATIPTIMVATALVYRKLSSQTVTEQKPVEKPAEPAATV